MSSKITDIGTYAFIVGAILVMTRPGSQGPQLVTALSSGISGLVKAATGQTTSASTPGGTRTAAVRTRTTARVKTITT